MMQVSKKKMIDNIMNEYGYGENGTDDLLMPHVLTDSNSVGYGGGVESLTEGSWPFDQPSEPNGPTPMATIDPQTYYGDGSDTGFELLDFIEEDPETGEQFHMPSYVLETGMYALVFYGILRNGYSLPDFTKLLVDNAEYDIYPMPEQEPASAGCYITYLEQELIDRQEIADGVKAVTGVDVKIGDALVVMQFDLVTEQVLSGDVPFTLYAGQDSWSGTLHEYVDILADVYGALTVNFDSTAYELTVYTDNCSNPYVKIGEDGEWQAYDENNKPSIYLPGDTYIYLKATSDGDGREVTGGSEYRITYVPGGTYQPYIVENPSNMFAGATLYINSSASYTTGSLTGRDDVVLQYKVLPSNEWLTAQLTNTSAGYFAELNLGWGQKTVTLRITVSGELAFESTMGTLDLKPMTPSFVDIINDQGTYYARLRFGANYPDMNTVETIEYSFDNENWTDAVHDATSGYELAEIQYYANSYTLPDGIWIRTKLISDNTVYSNTIESPQFDTIYVQIAAGRTSAFVVSINGKNLSNGDQIDIIKNLSFCLDIQPQNGYTFYSMNLREDSIGRQRIIYTGSDNPKCFIAKSDYTDNLLGYAAIITVDAVE